MARLPSMLAAACRREAGEELECYTEERPAFAALRSTRSLRHRIMPAQRASSRHRCARGLTRANSLMAESKLMLKKNQNWLSLEDLSAPPESPEVELTHPGSQGIERRCGKLLNTIPDTACATLTLPLPDTPGVLLSSPATAPASPSASWSFFEYQDANTSPASAYTLESSGTLTPSSDATLSPGPSFEVLSSSPSTGSHASHRKDSASFTMCRGDSVDGLFMSIMPASSPPEVEEVVVPSSMAQQSPFRRQLFTSLLTRQSALVSRVSHQSRQLLHIVDTVTRFTTHKDALTPVSQDSLPPASQGRAAPPEPSAVGADVWLDDLEHLQEGVLPFHARAAERLQSICDSGLGFDTDDDVTSQSHSSPYISSDDGDELVERDGDQIKRKTHDCERQAVRTVAGSSMVKGARCSLTP